MFKIVGAVIGVISFFSFLLLAFAFRDFSLILLLQFVLTLVGICLAQYLLTTHKLKLEGKELEEDEIDLDGRFGITRY